MSADPRHKNIVFGQEANSEFIDSYRESLFHGLGEVDVKVIKDSVSVIEECARKGGTVYFAGNGGSAAICDHIVCDFTKGTYHVDHPTVRAISMTENMALYSAIANDFGFEKVFSFQVESVMGEDDVLIAISSSGNSQNVVDAVEAANAKGNPTIGLSGFSGGKLREVSSHALYVPVDNYGVVENAHSAILHIMLQVISTNRDRS